MKKKVFFVLFFFATLAILLPQETSAQFCTSTGGVAGGCSSSSSCSQGSTWSNFYTPAFICTVNGGGCCTPDCTLRPPTNVCPVTYHNITCPVATGTTFCCDTATQCSSLQNGRTPGGPVQNPTCGDLATSNEISTAIGCIDFQDTTAFTGLILKWLVGIGGGVAFLLILSGAFTVMTSSGNPERLKQGQEVITAAVSGLILLIFSIFVLKFIGIDILGLGAFGFGT